MNNYSKDVSIFYGFNSGSNDITEKNAFANFVEQVGTLIQRGMISKDEANQVFLAMLLTHGDAPASAQHVGAELKAVMAAVLWGKQNGYTSFTFYHSYEGVEK